MIDAFQSYLENEWGVLKWKGAAVEAIGRRGLEISQDPQPVEVQW